MAPYLWHHLKNTLSVHCNALSVCFLMCIYHVSLYPECIQLHCTLPITLSQKTRECIVIARMPVRIYMYGISIYTNLLSQAAVFCVWSCHALQRMHSRSSPKTFTLASIGDIPYENRFVRNLVDSCAFHIYGHWVKRGEEQNRALLFETAPKKLSQISSQVMSGLVGPKTLWSH